jgi:hypothetical protein
MDQGYTLALQPRRQVGSGCWKALLLMEIMKTSDHSAASIVVPQVVAMDAFGAN